jgi:hypothetical protein
MMVLDASLQASQWSEKMYRKPRTKPGSIMLMMLVAADVTASDAAQMQVLAVGPVEVEVQVRQQWRESEATCETSNQTRIDHVDMIDSDEFKKWLLNRHAIYGKDTVIFPKGNYVRVASPSQSPGDGVTVYGPVHHTLKKADFQHLVGLPICNYRMQTP